MMTGEFRLGQISGCYDKLGQIT